MRRSGNSADGVLAAASRKLRARRRRGQSAPKATCRRSDAAACRGALRRPRTHMHSVTAFAFLDHSAKFTASSPSGLGPRGCGCPGSASKLSLPDDAFSGAGAGVGGASAGASALRASGVSGVSYTRVRCWRGAAVAAARKAADLVAAAAAASSSAAARSGTAARRCSRGARVGATRRSRGSATARTGAARRRSTLRGRRLGSATPPRGISGSRSAMAPSMPRTRQDGRARRSGAATLPS